MKLIDLTKVHWQWIALIFIAFIWGSSFILMKKGLESFSYFQVGTMRIFIAFLFLLPVVIRRFKKFDRKNIFPLLIIGFIGNLLPALLFTKAQTEISSTMAGMLNSLTPFFTLLVGVVFYGTLVGRKKVIGIFIGFTGAIGLILSNSNGDIGEYNSYALFIVLATSFYAIGVNVVKNSLQNLDGLTITAFAFLFIGPLAGISLFFTDFAPALASPDFYENLIFVIILALFSSVVAVSFFNILIKYTTAIFGASVTYIIPIFAILWGLFDGESVGFSQLIFMAIIMMGVYLVNKEKTKSLLQKT